VRKPWRAPIAPSSAARDLADLRGPSLDTSSFTKAAEELALTSKCRQPSKCERLRSTSGRGCSSVSIAGIELTTDGRTFLEGARCRAGQRHACQRNACENQRRVGVLTVAAPAAFAIWWLVPRLGRFAALQSRGSRGPDCRNRLDVRPDLWRDWGRRGGSLSALQKAAACQPPPEMPLLREVVYPVCSRSLLDGGSPLRQPRRSCATFSYRM